MTFRGLVLRIHGWIGIAVGALLVVLGLTGSVLVFNHEIDAALNPALRRVAPAGARAPLDSILAAGARAAPGGTVGIVRWPRAADASIELWLDDHGDRIVYVDPYSARPLGVREATSSLTGLLFRVHTKLLAGPAGERIVGVAAIVLLLMALSGGVLWWRERMPLGRRLRIHRTGNWKRTNFDVHNSLGIYSAALLALSAFTGASLIFHETYERAIDALTATPPPVPPPTVPPHPGLERLPFEEVWSRAERALPGGSISYISLPRRADAPFVVRKRLPGEFHPNGKSLVYVDPYTGAVLRTQDARSGPRGDRIYSALYPLHIGLGFGMATRVLAVFVGLAPAILFVSGILMWRNRRRKRPRRRAIVPDAGTAGARRGVAAASSR